MSVILLIEFRQPSSLSFSSSPYLPYSPPPLKATTKTILKLSDRRFRIDLRSVSSYYYPDSISSTLSRVEAFAWAVAAEKADEFWEQFKADDKKENEWSRWWSNAKSYYDDGCLDSEGDDEEELNEGKDEVDGRNLQEKSTCNRRGCRDRYERAARTRARMFERPKRQEYEEREAMARYEFPLHYEVLGNYKMEMRFYEEFRERQRVYVPRMLATVEVDCTSSKLRFVAGK